VSVFAKRVRSSGQEFGKRRRESERGPFACQDCGKVFAWVSNLYRHRSRECGKEPQFPCLFCPRRLTQKQSLERHMRRQHAEQFVPQTEN